MTRLKGDKAPGLDGLDDTFYKALDEDDMNNIGSCLQTLQWHTQWPEYLYKARLAMLTKTGDPYPPINKLREISILPATTKIIELMIVK